MIELEEASILYLDDQMPHLKQTKQEFKQKGLDLDITQSVRDAKKRAIGNQVNILICDLKMASISEQQGNEILIAIRGKNEHVFLALFSAYTRELSDNEIKFLDDNGIYHYGKDNTHNLMLNLQDDFRSFQNQKEPVLVINKDIPTNEDIMEVLQQEIAASLRRISNQELHLPVKGHENLTVAEIANEVDMLSPIGRKFMKEWVRSTSRYKK